MYTLSSVFSYRHLKLMNQDGQQEYLPAACRHGGGARSTARALLSQGVLSGWVELERCLERTPQK